MGRAFGEPAKASEEEFRIDPFRIADGLSDQFFCELGGASDCGHTTPGTEAGLNDLPFVDFDGQFQHISTDWIFDLDSGGGIRQLARVSGTLEVVKDLRGVHGGILSS